MHDQNANDKLARSIIGTIFFILIAGSLVLAVASFIQQQPYELTKKAVRTWTNKLDARTIRSGAYRHWDGEVLQSLETEEVAIEVISLPENDGWGQALQVAYLKQEKNEILIVLSLGPDGAKGTEDDITHSAFTGVRKALKDAVTEGIKETGRNWMKGLIQGAKEELFKKKEEEN